MYRVTSNFGLVTIDFLLLLPLGNDSSLPRVCATLSYLKPTLLQVSYGNHYMEFVVALK